MHKATTLTLALSFVLMLPACTESNSGTDAGHTHGDDSHTHADGSTYGEHDDTHTHADGSTYADHDDEHESIELDAITIDGMRVELTQNHGPVNAGEEEHLIVRVDGEDILAVRVWIGTEDRTLSYVGKGEYAVLNDAFEAHTMAPDPLPENTMWWIEIEKADGTKVIGSAQPVM
jgi:hypothetical protein